MARYGIFNKQLAAVLHAAMVSKKKSTFLFMVTNYQDIDRGLKVLEHYCELGKIIYSIKISDALFAVYNGKCEVRILFRTPRPEKLVGFSRDTFIFNECASLPRSLTNKFRRKKLASIHGVCFDNGMSGNCGIDCEGFLSGECENVEFDVLMSFDKESKLDDESFFEIFNMYANKE